MGRERYAGWAVGLLLLISTPSAAQDLAFMEYARVDPEKIMTAEACGECHIRTYDVWKTTPHATTFKTMHRKERAETIAEKLGFGLIKRDSFCFSCHYTPTVSRGTIRAVSGVSCESCHGAGADWIEVHNDYGPDATWETESPAHGAERIEASRAAGMRRPSDLYGVAANCFSCHSVPNEDLVNIGGHSTGSSGFEFVEWSQGEIRHNFLGSFRSGGAAINAERSSERRRTMYVAGRALDLEYSLRGAAVARDEGIYAKAMSRRVRSATAEVRAIASRADVPELDAILATVKGVQVRPGHEAALLAAADEIGRRTRAFLARADTAVGARLAAIDPLLLGIDEVEVADVEPESAVEPVGSRVAEVAGPDPAEGGEATTAEAPSGGTPGQAARSTVGVVGRIKRRIRPASDHATVGSSACSGCHTEQNEWWGGHAHYHSADPFFDGETRNVQIARLYGIDPAQMTTGWHVCMDCHGTIVSGKESRDVLDGVSCESCHGGAADWLEPHKDEAGKDLGADRPGYQEALRLGKAALDRMPVRAEVCTGCHYITEPRLLSAGHPSGASFDYVEGMNSVRHWAGPSPAASIQQAFAQQLASRGAVPSVQVASLTGAPAGGSEGGTEEPARTKSTPSSTVEAVARGRRARLRRRSAGLDVPAPRPVFDVGLAEGVRGDLDLPPFPEISEQTSIEDSLLMLEERLRLLYESVGPPVEDEN